MVLQNPAQNPLILQDYQCGHMLAEKVYFLGR